MTAGVARLDDPLEPAGTVPTPDSADEEEQTVGQLVESTIPERIDGQGAVPNEVWLAACLVALAVAALAESPVCTELRTGWSLLKARLNLGPRDAAVPVHEVRRNGVGHTLKREASNHPVEERG